MTETELALVEALLEGIEGAAAKAWVEVTEFDPTSEDASVSEFIDLLDMISEDIESVKRAVNRAASTRLI